MLFWPCGRSSSVIRPSYQPSALSMEDHKEHHMNGSHQHENHYLHPVPFNIPTTYDYSKSSEENYQQANAPFVGKYQSQRSQLDYTFHMRYSEERQLLHDKLIDKFHRTKVLDRKHNLVCESPLENWIVFTAGPMGAGKGHTIQWLARQNLFPIDAFVNVDPDAIRALLPETVHYNMIDDLKTGFLTQKEVGYISEVSPYCNNYAPLMLHFTNFASYFFRYLR